MELSAFENLRQLPLLQGLSLNELSQLVQHIKLDFAQHEEGTVLINQGERCDRLVYILSGTVVSDYRPDDIKMIYSEQYDHLPMLVEPYHLYGMTQRYERTYTFITEGSTFTINKRLFMDYISNYMIVKANMLNLICNQLQNARRLMRQPIGETMEMKLLQFVQQFATTPQGKKSIRILYDELANHIQETRLNVSFAVRRLEKLGVCRHYRGCLEINDMAQFVNAIRKG